VTQNSQSGRGLAPAKRAARAAAGFTEVFVTGMLTRWIRVRASPIARPAKPGAARLLVAPRITRRNANVMTISVTSPETREKPAGDRSP
jgi:hypothetical protein